ncbi:MAG: endolytic transglycosylase MltG [Paludibacter sp.]|nr:endolytic transglycosylase MltG [Paludibacter sp.]
MKKKKKILFSLIIIVLATILVGGTVFVYIFSKSNVSLSGKKETFIYIYPDYSVNQVITEINKVAKIKNRTTLNFVAKTLKYTDNKVRAGRYAIYDGMSNLTLVRELRNGQQTPVNLTFNNIRTKEQLAARIAEQLIADSLSIITLLNDTNYLKPLGLTPATSITLFIPDTYEMYWTTYAPSLFKRMEKEYHAFWTDARLKKARQIPLSAQEVATLASIVEEETNYQPERPTVAGLYINRLRQHIKLQADPTVKYANADFKLRRVLNSHLTTQSPYNTYQVFGLPPGPIRIASRNGIDAVLNYAHHNYLFMCAKETFDGTHNFATTYAEHQQNARRYQQALDQRNIK